jgi:membrane protein
MPRSDWLEISFRVARDISQKKLTFLAAGAALKAFLAIPAGIAVLVSLAIFAFGASTIQNRAGAVQSVIPGYLRQILTDPHSVQTLAIGLLVGLAVDLWSVLSGGSCMLTALTLACGEEERRSFIKRQMIVLALAAITFPFLLLSLALIAVPPPLIDRLTESAVIRTMISVLRWPILMLLFITALVWIYRFVPQRAGSGARWRSPGVLITASIWTVGSAGFSIYLSKFQAIDPSFGALGAIMILLTWLNFTAFMVLLGAQINDEIEHNAATATADGERDRAR